jgi:hypothetical protein
MDDDGQELYAHELMQERYRENVEALKRCAEKGANPKDLARLAFECGVDIKHITVEARNG